MPDVTIAVTRYDEPDGLVRDAVASLSRQRGVDAEVLFLLPLIALPYGAGFIRSRLRRRSAG